VYLMIIIVVYQHF